MMVKQFLKDLLNKHGSLRAVVYYVRNPSVLERDVCGWFYRRALLAKNVDGLDPVTKHPERVVVSLTSYGKRLSAVHLTIRSLMKQTRKPEKIVLWLNAENEAVNLPAALKDLEDYGLDIRYGCEDLKGHKKYFWALREYSDACVITVDDDVIYPADTIESLMVAHRRYPEAVVGRRVHRIVAKEGELSPYAEWEFEWHEGDSPRNDLLATGVGGVLYPPHCFGEQAFDLGSIMSTGLGNDDLWLKANELIEGRLVAWAPCSRIHPYVIVEDQDEGLCDSNVHAGGNDRSIRAIEKALGVSFLACAS